MEPSNISDSLQSKFHSGILSHDENSDILTFTVNKTIVSEVICFLKEQMGFQFLTDLCGIHYPDDPLPLGVVYHLHNMALNIRLRLKTFTSLDQPEIRSISDIFSAANWMERETYDFFGIIFTDHPNMTRILNVEYLDYFPMRKEFPLEDQTRKDKDNSYFGR